MEKALKDFTAVLRTAGYSVTTARMLVFRAMYGRPPVRMHDLAEVCHDIDRASVYRVIRLFEKLGVVNRIYTGWKYTIELSEPYHAHHHHIHCIECHSILSIHDDDLESIVDAVADRYHLELSSHTIELHGTCDSCRQSTKKITPTQRAGVISQTGAR